jgi:Bacterial regulatory proteins, luxR family
MTSQDARARRIEWIGSYARDHENLQRTMEKYFGSFVDRDPLNDRISNVQQIELIHLSAQCPAFVKRMTTLSIAESMGVKESTVETYARRAFAKPGVNSRRGLLSAVHGMGADERLVTNAE